MVSDLPIYISFIFGLTVLVAILWFSVAAKSKTFLLVLAVWAVVQSVIELKGIYLDTAAMPPRLMLLGICPALVAIAITFLTNNGKKFIDSVNLKALTYFHSIRILVEIVLLLLYRHGFVPRNITFEGTNFDLFSGVTAPIAAYIAFRNPAVNKKFLLGWNILCLLLLLNVVITAVLAAPFPFQKIAFDQPNVAILYFPFNLLPSIVVPLVFFAHLVAIRQLTKMKQSNAV